MHAWVQEATLLNEASKLSNSTSNDINSISKNTDLLQQTQHALSVHTGSMISAVTSMTVTSNGRWHEDMSAHLQCIDAGEHIAQNPEVTKRGSYYAYPQSLTITVLVGHPLPDGQTWNTV